ncbi:MAG: S-methyl-5-thioribose-1-phosphate isomerase [Chloroflexi bacterium]|nr:S-methyl-5-thioribose-1-phosphate isomerase [Chloroflexota bacterium]
MRTLEWDREHQQLKMIDQRALPGELKWLTLSTHLEVAECIHTMAARGAPAIGAAAAYGLALAAARSRAANAESLKQELRQAAARLGATRPTAVNLAWALKRVMAKSEGFAGSAAELAALTLAEAERIANEDVDANERMAAFGAALIRPGETVIHHCNTGALATVDWGTALGVIRKAHEQGKGIRVLVDETRPRLQGAKLTAWELQQYGVPFEIISDNAAGYFLSRGEAQRVLVGADRVAANGDVANKIGTYMLALAAHANDVPFYVVAPTSTFDHAVASGKEIPIEERDPAEVLELEQDGMRVAPAGAQARNPAFDITPHTLVTAFVTENGVVYPPYEKTLRELKAGQ